jgi:hypothetical protein
MGEILNNREAIRKNAKCAIELSMYDIVYNPSTAIKAQALSNFVAEWTETQIPPRERELEYWTINFDGSIQLQGTGAGILVTSLKGENFKYGLQMHFPASNIVVEYGTLLHGLRIDTAPTDSRFLETHCSLSFMPTKSGHVLMTNCCCIAKSFAISKTISTVLSTCISCEEKMRSWII